HIDGGVDAQMICALSTDQIAELVLYVISEIRGVRDVDASLRRSDFQIRSFRFPCLFLIDGSGFGHRLEYLIAPRLRSVQVVIRIVAIWTTNQARKKSGFRQA